MTYSNNAIGHKWACNKHNTYTQHTHAQYALGAELSYQRSRSRTMGKDCREALPLSVNKIEDDETKRCKIKGSKIVINKSKR